MFDHYSSPIHNNQEHEEIAQFAANRIRWSTGTIIRPRQGYQYGGSIGGTSLDYAFGLGFPLAFVFEMSGKGMDGEEYKFFPPTLFIRSLAAESWTGIRALAEKAIQKYPSNRPIYNSRLLNNAENAAPSPFSFGHWLTSITLAFNYIAGKVF